MGRTHNKKKICVQCIMHVCKFMQCWFRSPATRCFCLRHKFQTPKSSIFELILLVSNECSGWNLTWVYAKLKAQSTFCMNVFCVPRSRRTDSGNVILKQLLFINRSLVLILFIGLLGHVWLAFLISSLFIVYFNHTGVWSSQGLVWPC